jgi:hypothetical protein
VWIIVTDVGTSSDDGAFGPTSLVVRGLVVQCGGLERVVVLFFPSFLILS